MTGKRTPTMFGVTATIVVTLVGLISSSSSSSVELDGKNSRFEIPDSSAVMGFPNSRRNSAKCVDIPENLTLCHGIGYSQMRLPNLLEHETLGEVTHHSAFWMPLLATRCSSNTKLLLCSLFTPVCLDRPIYPCRSLCLTVKSGCEERMEKFGFPWPEMLDCDQFPSEHDLCIAPQPVTSLRNGTMEGEDKNFGNSSVCPACMGSSITNEQLINYYCSADFVAKVMPETTVIHGNNLKIISGKKTKFYKSSATTALYQHPGKPRHMFHLPNGATCDCDGLNLSLNISPTQRKSRKSDQYIVMGHQLEKDRLTVTFAVNLKSKILKKALRMFESNDVCMEDSGRGISIEKPHKVENHRQLRRKINKRNKNHGDESKGEDKKKQQKVKKRQRDGSISKETKKLKIKNERANGRGGIDGERGNEDMEVMQRGEENDRKHGEVDGRLHKRKNGKGEKVKRRGNNERKQGKRENKGRNRKEKNEKKKGEIKKGKMNSGSREDK